MSEIAAGSGINGVSAESHIRSRATIVLRSSLSCVFTSRLPVSPCCSHRKCAPHGRVSAGTGVTSARVRQATRRAGVAVPRVTRDTLYVFLSEGTLRIASPNTRPLLGTWKYERGEFLMVEAGPPSQGRWKRFSCRSPFIRKPYGESSSETMQVRIRLGSTRMACAESRRDPGREDTSKPLRPPSGSRSMGPCF